MVWFDLGLNPGPLGHWRKRSLRVTLEYIYIYIYIYSFIDQVFWCFPRHCPQYISILSLISSSSSYWLELLEDFTFPSSEGVFQSFVFDLSVTTVLVTNCLWTFWCVRTNGNSSFDTWSYLLLHSTPLINYFTLIVPCNDIPNMDFYIILCIVASHCFSIFFISHISLAYKIAVKTMIWKRLSRTALFFFAFRISLIVVNLFLSDLVLRESSTFICLGTSTHYPSPMKTNSFISSISSLPTTQYGRVVHLWDV